MKIIDFAGQCQPDPYIIEHDGWYYIYASGYDGVSCYKSRNLFSGWEYTGKALKVEGQKEYWAPAVIEDNGTFYMYYSSVELTCDDAHQEKLKVAVCDKPEGPFKFVKDLVAPFSIDAHVVKNQEGLYIFYSVNDYDAEKAGTYIVCDKMKDFFTVCGEPKAMVRPTIKEEIFECDRFKKGQDWYTIEGAFYFKEGDYHYLIYSANSFMKPEYHLGYAVSDEKTDELDRLHFKKISETEFKPLLTGDDVEISTGHNSLIKVGGQYYIVYHGRDKDKWVSIEANGDDRTARIKKLNADGGVLTVENI